MQGHVGSVEPMHSTNEGEGLVFLQKKPDLGNASHLNLYTIDGGVFIDRSNETEEFEELQFGSDEGWTMFQI